MSVLRVILVGGPRDGDRVDLPDWMRDFRVPLPPEFTLTPPEAVTVPDIRVVTYRPKYKNGRLHMDAQFIYERLHIMPFYAEGGSDVQQ